jgi:hypothetical protein
VNDAFTRCRFWHGLPGRESGAAPHGLEARATLGATGVRSIHVHPVVIRWSFPDGSAASAAISDGRIILKGSKNLFSVMEKK